MTPHVSLYTTSDTTAHSPLSLLASKATSIQLTTPVSHPASIRPVSFAWHCPYTSLPSSWVLSLNHTFLFSACSPERTHLLLARHLTVVPAQCWRTSTLGIHVHSCRHFKIPRGACPASAQNQLHLLWEQAPVWTPQLPSMCSLISNSKSLLWWFKPMLTLYRKLADSKVIQHSLTMFVTPNWFLLLQIHPSFPPSHLFL